MEIRNIMKIIITLGILLLTCNLAFSQRSAEELFKAINEGNLKEVKKLTRKMEGGVNYSRNISDSFVIPILVQATMKDQTEIAKYLIDEGADVNSKDGFKMTCLMWAAHNGNAELVNLLIEKKADLHAKTEEGMTALRGAKEEGHTEVQRIIEKAIWESGAK